VYLMSDHTSPIATYRLGGVCYSGIITDRHLYLGVEGKLHLFEVTTSLSQPLVAAKVIYTILWVYIILRVGHELILGEVNGYLEVFDIETSSITHTHSFTETGNINDIIAIDGTHYLLAADKGLLKTSKNQLINRYHKGKVVRSLCHITHSIFLVGFQYLGLILWNEETD
jgi:hypothetical protein